MTVSLICGSESKLGDVTEPSRCEYAAVFTTPAACTDLELETLELELKELNDEVEEEKEL
jgi:protein kinase C substrate 80K-H